MSIYDGVRLFVQQVTGNYFRNIHVVGLENMPMSGPTILCCNHSNQFMDGMLVLARCPRPLSFCFAASSYSKPIVGYLAKKINVIPVYRAEDSKLLGKGKIKMVSEEEVEGNGTKFISGIKNNKDFALGLHSLLVDNKYKLIVEKVIDEEHIKVRSDPHIFDILKTEKHSFFFIPKMDNSRMFKETYSKLHEGRAVCIFPEGTSHDRSHFLQLKAGVAFMALGAMANHGTKGIKLISCGLTYFNRDQFRSDVIIEFGIPYEIPEDWGEIFKINKKEAIERILKVVESQMKAVTLTAPTYKEYICVLRARDLYVPLNSGISPQDSTKLARRMATVYDTIKDNKDVKVLKRKIYKYMELLENSGFEDQDLQQLYFDYTYFVRKTLFSFILFHVYLICALPMIFISLPLVWFVRKKAERERIKALEKNPNKIQAKDVVSSVKVTTFVKYLPLVNILWIIICYLFINFYLYQYTKTKYSLLFIISLGCFSFLIYGYLSILMVDSLNFYLETMKTRFFFFCFPKYIYRLKDMRKNLEDEMNEFVNIYVKNTEYENKRIIQPSKEIKEKEKEKKRTLKGEMKILKNDLKSILNKFGI